MTDALEVLLGANLALAVAVAVVMAARLPVRRLFGARVAYGLWTLPPLAAVAMLVPARMIRVTVPAPPAPAGPAGGEMLSEAAATGAAAFDPGPLLAALWLIGVIASLAWVVRRQVQFARAVRAGKAGPAVVGVLRPRVVTPADFAERYTPREREVVLAHERTHLERGDPPVNAVLALLTCVNWFNPACHVMTRWLRIDQELACDARVVAAHPKARKAYAEAMLKTQLAARPLPLGCHWSSHPLAQRVRLLSRPSPSRARRLMGVGLTVALGVTGAVATWSSRPARIVLIAEALPVAQARPAVVSPPPAPSASSSPRQPTRPRVKAAETPAVASAPEPVLAQAETQPAPALEAPPVADLRYPRIIRAIADRSAVEPGSAVRVIASGLAPDGPPLWADFTAFGSQRLYRKGAYQRSGSRYSLFTSVVQDGQRLRVTVSLGKAFRPELTGSIDLAPNQTGILRLPTGQPIVVTATMRPETPDEIEEGRRLSEYAENTGRPALRL
ncbi:M56 family metallopeptidase [Caulobacter sp. 1776]|uniref:M56 family metallopeptidase n=1 Tax=Caulobacter sp. 1776 TaxID=3156420 RepID=UPI003398297A